MGLKTSQKKILIITASDPFKVAGILALDLYRGLQEIEGYTVKMLVRPYGTYHDKEIIPLTKWYQPIKEKVNRKIIRTIKKIRILKNIEQQTHPDYHVLDFNQTTEYFSTHYFLRKARFNPDVIIVLFMHKTITYKNLYELNIKTNAPILLYMMDTGPMTGGCHYSWDCLGYSIQCGNCPALYSKEQYDQSYRNLKSNLNYITKTNIYPISVSEWQALQLNNSVLFKDKKKFKVLEPCNPYIFTSGTKHEAKKHFNLSSDKIDILFGAMTINSKRKGFLPLIEALTIFRNMVGNDANRIRLIIVGHINKELEELLPFNYVTLGYLSIEELSLAYRAAYLFVCPSIEEAGPLMISQSIMCGTPVVAFKMGVAYDIVINGKTGYIAELNNSKDLAMGILKLTNLSENEYNEMSKNCRELALLSYGYQNVALNFQNIINKIIL